MTKSIIALALMIIAAGPALANDGGIAAIKVDQIKMREIKYENGEEVVIKRYTNPQFSTTFEGGEAEKLQKILPSESSVVTAMKPAIEKEFNETFKALGIYSDKSDAATAKAISIHCANGELVDGGTSIKKTGKTKCTIEITGNVDGDLFGDAQEFNPKTCQ